MRRPLHRGCIVDGEEHTTPNDRPDAIVVGAGLAGLAAAREQLWNAGQGVLVLEGRDRLGGRAWTSAFAGMDVELGGQFVHWFQPHIFAEMTRYGLSFDVPPEPTRCSYLSQGRVQNSTVGDLLPRMSGLFQRLFPDAFKTLPLPHRRLAVPDVVAAVDRLSVQDRIDRSDLSAEERGLLTRCSARPALHPARTPRSPR